MFLLSFFGMRTVGVDAHAGEAELPVSSERGDGGLGFLLHLVGGIALQGDGGIADAGDDIPFADGLCHLFKIAACADFEEAERGNLKISSDVVFRIGAAMVDAEAGEGLRQTDIVRQQMLAVLRVRQHGDRAVAGEVYGGGDLLDDGGYAAGDDGRDGIQATADIDGQIGDEGEELPGHFGLIVIVDEQLFAAQVQRDILNAHEVDRAFDRAKLLHEEVDLALHLLPEGVAVEIRAFQRADVLFREIRRNDAGRIGFGEFHLAAQQLGVEEAAGQQIGKEDGTGLRVFLADTVLTEIFEQLAAHFYVRVHAVDRIEEEFFVEFNPGVPVPPGRMEGDVHVFQHDGSPLERMIHGCRDKHSYYTGFCTGIPVLPD